MADNKMEIIIEAVDNSTKELQKIKSSLKDVENSTQAVGKKTEEATKTIEQRFRAAGKEIRDFTKALFVVTAIVAAISKVTTEWAKQNQETHNAISSLKTSVVVLASNIGSLLAPAIIGIATALKSVMPVVSSFFENLRNGFNQFNQWVTFGVQYWVAFYAALREGTTETEASGIALNVAGAAAKEAGEKFNAAFSQNTTTQINSMEEALKRLGETWASWESSSHSDMSGMVMDSTVMADRITAYQNFYQALSRLRSQDDAAYNGNLQAQTEAMRFANEQRKTIWQVGVNFMTTTYNKFSAGLGTAIAGIVTGTKKAGEAFKEFGMMMISTIVEFMVQAVIQATIGRALAAIISTSTILQASALATAWALPATLASIATLGGAAAIGSAAVVASSASSFGVLSGMQAGIAAGSLVGATAMAEGGSGIVTRPTLFLAGESGAEHFAFSPLSKGGTSNSQVITINMGGVSVRNDSDIDTLTEEISRRLARETERL